MAIFLIKKEKKRKEKNKKRKYIWNCSRRSHCTAIEILHKKEFIIYAIREFSLILIVSHRRIVLRYISTRLSAIYFVFVIAWITFNGFHDDRKNGRKEKEDEDDYEDDGK